MMRDPRRRSPEGSRRRRRERERETRQDSRDNLGSMPNTTTADLSLNNGGAMPSYSSNREPTTLEMIDEQREPVARGRPGSSSASSSTSLSSSLLDISRRYDTRRFGGVLTGFFRAPSEHRRRHRRKSRSGKRGVLYFANNNSSSSSVDSDMAYGNGYIKRVKSRNFRSRDGAGVAQQSRREPRDPYKSGSSKKAKTDDEILALGRQLSDLARQQNEEDLRNAGKSRPSGLVAAASRISDYKRRRDSQLDTRGIGSSRPHGDSSDDASDWESASEDEDSSSDSDMAYGSVIGHLAKPAMAAAAAGAAGAVMATAANRRKDSSKSSVVDPRLFGPVNSLHGVLRTPCGFGDDSMNAAARADRVVEPSRPPSDYPEQIRQQEPMRKVYAVPTSDPTRYDADRGSLVSSRQDVSQTSRPGPVPIQQPIPKPLVSSRVYNADKYEDLDRRDERRESRRSEDKGHSSAALAAAAGGAALVGAAIASDRKSDRKEDRRDDRRDDRKERKRDSREYRDEEKRDRERRSEKSDKSEKRDRDSKRRDTDGDKDKERRKSKRDSYSSKYPDERDHKRSSRQDSFEDLPRKKREVAVDHYPESSSSRKNPDIQVEVEPDSRSEVTRTSRRDSRKYDRSDKYDDRDERRGLPKSTKAGDQKDAESTQTRDGTTVNPFLYQVPDDAFMTPQISSTPARPLTPTVFTVEREPDFDELIPKSPAPSDSRLSRKDSFEIERMADDPRGSHKGFRRSDPRMGHDYEESEHEARSIYDEAKHATVPISAAAVASAMAVEAERSRERRRDQYSDDGSRERSSYNRDTVQEDADRYYRETEVARKIAAEEIQSSRGTNHDESILDKYEDKDKEVPTIVTPPEMDKVHNKGRYDAPDADVRIDNRIFPDDSHRFRADRALGAPDYSVRDPSAERERPLLNLVFPTPVPSRQPTPAVDRSRAGDEKDRDVASKEDKPVVVTVGPDGVASSEPSSRSVTWGETETNVYSVETPEPKTEEELSRDRDAASAKPRGKLNKTSQWGMIAAAIAGSSAEPDNEPEVIVGDSGKIDNSAKGAKQRSKGPEMSMPMGPDQIYVDASQPPVPGPKPSSSKSDQMPGQYADDVEFAGTLAAGLEDAGFDPNIVIDDPNYRRRDSPPGSDKELNGNDWYQRPFSETVTDLGTEQATARASRDPGFVLGEVETPGDAPAGVDEWTETPTKLSKKDKKRQEKLAKRRSVEAPESVTDDFYAETPASSTAREEPVDVPIKLSKKEQKKRDRAAKAQALMLQDEDQPFTAEPETIEPTEAGPDEWEDSKSKKGKKSRKSRDFDDGSSSRVSVPVDAFEDVQSSMEAKPDDEWDTKKSKKKSKRDSTSYEPRSTEASEVSTSSKRSKLKRRSGTNDDFDDYGDPPSQDRDPFEAREVSSVVSEPRYDERRSESRHKKRSSRYDDDDDAKSVASAPGGSRRSKESSEKRSSGLFSSIFKANGHKDEKDDKKKKDSKEESFLDNAGILGAGAGVAGAVAVASQMSRSHATDGSSDKEPRLPSTHEHLDDYDPEIVPRAIKPAIDPQYGDLLPLPPSEPGTPVDSGDELPGLPDSRPDTPPEERNLRRPYTHQRRRSAQETPVKSPSETAIPISLRLGQRGPSSPGFFRASPSSSPVAPTPESAGSARRSARPTSWDSSRQMKPLLLGSQFRGESSDNQASERTPILSADDSHPFSDGLRIQVPPVTEHEIAGSQETTPRAEIKPELPALPSAGEPGDQPETAKESTEPDQVESTSKDRSSYLLTSTPSSGKSNKTASDDDLAASPPNETPSKQRALHVPFEFPEDLTSADEHFSDAKEAHTDDDSFEDSRDWSAGHFKKEPFPQPSTSASQEESMRDVADPVADSWDAPDEPIMTAKEKKKAKKARNKQALDFSESTQEENEPSQSPEVKASASKDSSVVKEAVKTEDFVEPKSGKKGKKGKKKRASMAWDEDVGDSSTPTEGDVVATEDATPTEPPAETLAPEETHLDAIMPTDTSPESAEPEVPEEAAVGVSEPQETSREIPDEDEWSMPSKNSKKKKKGKSASTWEEPAEKSAPLEEPVAEHSSPIAATTQSQDVADDVQESWDVDAPRDVALNVESTEQEPRDADTEDFWSTPASSKSSKKKNKKKSRQSLDDVTFNAPESDQLFLKDKAETLTEEPENLPEPTEPSTARNTQEETDFAPVSSKKKKKGKRKSVQWAPDPEPSDFRHYEEDAALAPSLAVSELVEELPARTTATSKSEPDSDDGLSRDAERYYPSSAGLHAPPAPEKSEESQETYSPSASRVLPVALPIAAVGAALGKLWGKGSAESSETTPETERAAEPREPEAIAEVSEKPEEEPASDAKDRSLETELSEPLFSQGDEPKIEETQTEAASAEPTQTFEDDVVQPQADTIDPIPDSWLTSSSSKKKGKKNKKKAQVLDWETSEPSTQESSTETRDMATENDSSVPAEVLPEPTDIAAEDSNALAAPVETVADDEWSMPSNSKKSKKAKKQTKALAEAQADLPAEEITETAALDPEVPDPQLSEPAAAQDDLPQTMPEDIPEAAPAQPEFREADDWPVALSKKDKKKKKRQSLLNWETEAASGTDGDEASRSIDTIPSVTEPEAEFEVPKKGKKGKKKKSISYSWGPETEIPDTPEVSATPEEALADVPTEGEPATAGNEATSEVPQAPISWDDEVANEESSEKEPAPATDQDDQLEHPVASVDESKEEPATTEADASGPPEDSTDPPPADQGDDFLFPVELSKKDKKKRKKQEARDQGSEPEAAATIPELEPPLDSPAQETQPEASREVEPSVEAPSVDGASEAEPVDSWDSGFRVKESKKSKKKRSKGLSGDSLPESDPQISASVEDSKNGQPIHESAPSPDLKENDFESSTQEGQALPDTPAEPTQVEDDGWGTTVSKKDKKKKKKGKALDLSWEPEPEPLGNAEPSSVSPAVEDNTRDMTTATDGATEAATEPDTEPVTEPAITQDLEPTQPEFEQPADDGWGTAVSKKDKKKKKKGKALDLPWEAEPETPAQTEPSSLALSQDDSREPDSATEAATVQEPDQLPAEVEQPADDGWGVAAPKKEKKKKKKGKALDLSWEPEPEGEIAPEAPIDDSKDPSSDAFSTRNAEGDLARPSIEDQPATIGSPEVERSGDDLTAQPESTSREEDYLEKATESQPPQEDEWATAKTSKKSKKRKKLPTFTDFADVVQAASERQETEATSQAFDEPVADTWEDTRTPQPTESVDDKTPVNQDDDLWSVGLSKKEKKKREKAKKASQRDTSFSLADHDVASAQATDMDNSADHTAAGTVDAERSIDVVEDYPAEIIAAPDEEDLADSWDELVAKPASQNATPAEELADSWDDAPVADRDVSTDKDRPEVDPKAQDLDEYNDQFELEKPASSQAAGDNLTAGAFADVAFEVASKKGKKGKKNKKKALDDFWDDQPADASGSDPLDQAQVKDDNASRELDQVGPAAEQEKAADFADDPLSQDDVATRDDPETSPGTAPAESHEELAPALPDTRDETAAQAEPESIAEVDPGLPQRKLSKKDKKKKKQQAFLFDEPTETPESNDAEAISQPADIPTIADSVPQSGADTPDASGDLDWTAPKLSKKDKKNKKQQAIFFDEPRETTESNDAEAISQQADIMAVDDFVPQSGADTPEASGELDWNAPTLSKKERKKAEKLARAAAANSLAEDVPETPAAEEPMPSQDIEPAAEPTSWADEMEDEEANKIAGDAPTLNNDEPAAAPTPAAADDEWAFPVKKSKKGKKGKKASGTSTPQLVDETERSLPVADDASRELDSPALEEASAQPIEDAAPTEPLKPEAGDDEWALPVKKKGKKGKKNKSVPLSFFKDSPSSAAEQASDSPAPDPTSTAANLDQQPAMSETLDMQEDAARGFDPETSAAAPLETAPDDEWAISSSKKKKKSKGKKGKVIEDVTDAPAEPEPEMVQEPEADTAKTSGDDSWKDDTYFGETREPENNLSRTGGDEAPQDTERSHLEDHSGTVENPSTDYSPMNQELSVEDTGDRSNKKEKKKKTQLWDAIAQGEAQEAPTDLQPYQEPQAAESSRELDLADEKASRSDNTKQAEDKMPMPAAVATGVAAGGVALLAEKFGGGQKSKGKKKKKASKYADRRSASGDDLFDDPVLWEGEDKKPMPVVDNEELGDNFWSGPSKEENLEESTRAKDSLPTPKEESFTESESGWKETARQGALLEENESAESPVLGRGESMSGPVALLRRGSSVEDSPGALLMEDSHAPVVMEDIRFDSPSEFRRSPIRSLPAVPEIPEAEADTEPSSWATPDINRDSGFVTDSPNPKRRSLPFVEEPQRDSGVHTDDWTEMPAHAPRTPEPASDRRLRRSPFNTPVLREPQEHEATPEPEKRSIRHCESLGQEAARSAPAHSSPPSRSLRATSPTIAQPGLAIGAGAVSHSGHRSKSDSHQPLASQPHGRAEPVARRSASNTSLTRHRTPEPLKIGPDSPGINRATPTPPLRRVDKRMSGDLRALRQQNNTTPVANESRVRTKDMADVYDGFGEGRIGSPRSPTRPHSMRRRQSMQVLELESRVEQLIAENRLLTDARTHAESNLGQRAVSVLSERDSEIEALKQSLQFLQHEVARLTEVNTGLSSANAELAQQDKGRFSDLEVRHADVSRELDETRGAHGESLQAKDAEIADLRAQLEAAKEQVREMQRQILDSKAGSANFLNIQDEDYFDNRCQQLCAHVQQWVLRFSKFSDMRACRLTSELNDEKTIDRLDNAVLDGSDVDTYLNNRVKRRDIFMSMTMNMIWEFVFTRYLFGMDREQRQKLKSLEKLLTEVGPPQAVRQWRAVTLTLLARRDNFKEQRDLDTEAVVQAVFQTLCKILPPPGNLEDQIQGQLRRVIGEAVDLSIEMRTQKAEYMMLPPLQPEYDADGELAATVQFNATMMSERGGASGQTAEELEGEGAIVRVVVFPLVVKKGDDNGVGEEEIVVCPAQVILARDKGKRHMTPSSDAGGASLGGPSHISVVTEHMGQGDEYYQEEL